MQCLRHGYYDAGTVLTLTLEVAWQHESQWMLLEKVGKGIFHGVGPCRAVSALRSIQRKQENV